MLSECKIIDLEYSG